MKWFFYILAILFAVAGLYALFSALNFPSVFQGVSPMVTTVLGPVWTTLTDSLSSFVRWIGIILLVVALGIAGLLVAIGHLLDGYLDLHRRVKRLEADMGERQA